MKGLDSKQTVVSRWWSCEGRKFDVKQVGAGQFSAVTKL